MRKQYYEEKTEFPTIPDWVNNRKTPAEKTAAIQYVLELEDEVNRWRWLSLFLGGLLALSAIIVLAMYETGLIVHY